MRTKSYHSTDLEKQDPTANVLALVAASIIRVDDLREAEQLRMNERMEAESRRIDEQLVLRADFAEKLSVAETKRLDAIRAVDATAISIANDRASAQAAVLANQVSASAEMLRALVATTAATQAVQLQSLTTQLTDRIALLEKSQYENRGTGSGMRDMWGWIFGGLVGLVSIISIVYGIIHH